MATIHEPQEESIPSEPLHLSERWHAMPISQVLAQLQSSERGLAHEEAQRRLTKFGPNAIVASGAEPAWRILARQLQSIVVALLVVATGLAFVMGDPLDGAAIAVVLLLNVVIGFITELRARRAMEALVGLDVATAVVVRDGGAREIDARTLVPGDVILLESGQAVPADGRLLAATDLQINEAALTGESVPALKSANAVLDPAAALPDRVTMVYKGTIVGDGVGRAAIVNTGMGTEVGRIGTLVRSIADEPTPLERRMDSLGRQLALVAVAVGVMVALLDLMRGAAIGAVLQMGIAVAIAAVPEGLPAVVTTTMAIAMRRMARRHALVRRLPAVEALGSVSVVCTDKTGTLTSGTQTVTCIWLADRFVDLEVGFKSGVSDDEERLIAALTIGALANRATIRGSGGGWEGRGDPTDVALLVAARQHGLIRAELLAGWPEAGELPFSSARMWMATLHQVHGRLVVCMKGAPHRVLERCTRILGNTGDAPLDSAARALVEERAASMADRGYRVLALADGEVRERGEQALHSLRLVALVGISDPPAPGVAGTIGALRTAGIRTVMLTGDHHATAAAIARDIGLATTAEGALDGSVLDRMSTEALMAVAGRVDVVSRVSPEGKLRMIDALQRRGDIVAMLGDGINDAAALKKADIGVAMGRRGSDAAKEVAGIVLEDDRFPTIAAAVEEGRVVVENIRKFVFYLFTCNIAEVAVLLVAGAAGLPLPMTPLQVLWMNLVTDTLPALALAIEPGEHRVLRQAPRDSDAPLLSGATLARGLVYTLLITAVTLFALVWMLARVPGAPARAVTLSFTTLALAQIFHLGNARSIGPVTAPSRIIANRFALAAVAITVTMQVLAVISPTLRRVLGTTPLSNTEWVMAFALSAIPAVVGQLWKLLRFRSDD